MIVNLPTWETVATSTAEWTGGVVTSFLPAAYWEIGLAAGVFVILIVLALVKGGLNSLLGMGGHSDPMRGIPSGNSGMGNSGRSGGFGIGRVGGVGGVNTNVSTYRGSTRGWGSRINADEKWLAQYQKRRGMIRENFDKRDIAKANREIEARQAQLKRERSNS